MVLPDGELAQFFLGFPGPKHCTFLGQRVISTCGHWSVCHVSVSLARVVTGQCVISLVSVSLAWSVCR